MSGRKREAGQRWNVTVGKLCFANPVIAASGTFGFGYEFKMVANRLGGIVTKAVTMLPREGNPPPRIIETASGVVNSVGLENPGLAVFKEKILPRLKGLRCQVIVNVAGTDVEEFCRIAGALEDTGVAALELNLSCPNVAQGGVALGQCPEKVAEVTAAVRRCTGKFLIVKLTANFVDPRDTAKAAEDSGADAVSLINTLFALVLDKDGKPLLGGKTGGLSGPAIKPFALFCVARVAGAVRIPVIGGGGITSGHDAYEFLCAGAKLVQVGTASLIEPRAPLRIWQELKQLLRKKLVNQKGMI